MFLAFPEFNIFSTPLLVLVSQGVLFGVLLLLRYQKKKIVSDILLALLVLITCYHRTAYTIGFMSWYDTFRTTKINYLLIPLLLAIGPLIYFYVKSVTTSDFRFKKKELFHFVPALLFVVYRISIFSYDVFQPGFDDEQNGVLMKQLVMGPVGMVIGCFVVLQQLIYLILALKWYYSYRGRIKDYFSNTYDLELNWIRNFLLIYTFLFVYFSVQEVVNTWFIDMSWIQKWWYQLFSALAVIYVGIKGYFTDTTKLKGLDFRINERSSFGTHNTRDTNHNGIEAKKTRLLDHMAHKKPYLNPDLNLIELAKGMKMSRAELSEAINEGFHKNFNDFINEYRVNAVKQMFLNGKQKQLSLLGIAYECGFNSKATFNRVFKRLTQTSPSEYIKTL
ncbi:MAG: AraC family transcriptional regulator [Bacteroidota bacterium]